MVDGIKKKKETVVSLGGFDRFSIVLNINCLFKRRRVWLERWVGLNGF